MSAGDYAGAEDCFARAIQICDRAEFHEALGMLRRKQGRVDEAIAEYLEALKRDRSLVNTHYNLANAYWARGSTPEAVASYQRALELAPQHMHARSALADLCYQAGCQENDREEYVAARDWFAKAVELVPEWLEARHNLGRAMYELGQVSEAFREFTRCSEMSLPGSEQSRAMLAVIAPGVPELDHAGILKARTIWR